MGNLTVDPQVNNIHDNVKCGINGVKEDSMASESSSISNYYHRPHSLHSIQCISSSVRCHDMNLRVLPPKPPMTKKTNLPKDKKVNKTTHETLDPSCLARFFVLQATL